MFSEVLSTQKQPNSMGPLISFLLRDIIPVTGNTGAVHIGQSHYLDLILPVHSEVCHLFCCDGVLSLNVAKFCYLDSVLLGFRGQWLWDCVTGMQ